MEKGNFEREKEIQGGVDDMQMMSRLGMISNTRTGKERGGEHDCEHENSFKASRI